MTAAVTPGRDAILSLLDLFESDIDHIHVTPHRREILRHTLRLAAKPADELRASEPANGLPTLDEYRQNLIEECAEIAKSFKFSEEAKQSTNGARTYGNDEVCEKIAAAILALSTTGKPKP